MTNSAVIRFNNSDGSYAQIVYIHNIPFYLTKEVILDNYAKFGGWDRSKLSLHWIPECQLDYSEIKEHLDKAAKY